jgi:hypothetical protein
VTLLLCVPVFATAAGATRSAGPAQLYISPTGTDAGRCTKHNPCRTFARAYLVAKAGQVVRLAGGQYAGQQRIPVDSSKRSSRDVVLRPAKNARVVVDSLDVYGRHVEVRGIRILNDFYVKCGAADVTLRGSKAASFFIRPADHVSIIRSEFGPAVNVSSTIGPSDDCAQPPSHILLDRVYMHGYHTEPHNSQHIECLMVNLADGLTIRNSRFRRCEDFDILVKRDFGDINISNLTLENNWFDDPYPDGYYTVLFSDPSNAAYTNVLIRNNSFNGSLLPVNSNGVKFTNFRIIGNVGTSIGRSCGVAGVTRSYNVWAKSSACNSTEKRAPTGFVNAAGFDLHLRRGAAAINRGDPGSFPRRDIDGQRRPVGKRPDAGADERFSGK